MPATIFTKNIDEIDKFIKKHKKIVIKPTHGYGGKNILFLNRKLKKRKILNYINIHEQVMVQKFLPKIKEGDKRIFVIGGLIKGAIKRIPKQYWCWNIYSLFNAFTFATMFFRNNCISITYIARNARPY